MAAPQAAVAAAAAAPEPEPAVAKPAAAAAATAPSRAASPPLEAAATAAAEVGGATIGDNDDTTVASEGSPSAATSGGGWRVVECKVGTDGTCENCGEVLRSIDLSKEDEDRLLQQVSAACCGTVLMPRFSNEGYLGFFGALGSRAFEPLPRLVCLSWDGATWSCFPAPVLGQGREPIFWWWFGVKICSHPASVFSPPAARIFCSMTLAGLYGARKRGSGDPIQTNATLRCVVS